MACLAKLAQMRREALDINMLTSVLLAQPPMSAQISAKTYLASIAQQMQLRAPKLLRGPDPAFCPLLVEEDGVWSIIGTRKPDGQWAVQAYDLEANALTEVLRGGFAQNAAVFRVNLGAQFVISQSPSLRMIWGELLAEKRGFVDVLIGSLFISVIALVTSIYSMQVYDRVIPTNATATLLVLTMGAVVAAVLDSVAKWVRSQNVSDLSDRVDQRLARMIYARFLGVRLDVMPASVGVIAQRMRSYESVRQFLVSFVTSFAVDIPLAAILLLVLWAIGGPLMLIPAGFLASGVLGALFVAKKIEVLARNAMPAHNLKTGHLVESVEGAEIIKSGNGGWRMLAKWLDLTDQSRGFDHDMKNVTEGFQFFIGLFQQFSYMFLVAFGALYVGTGAITMGGLIACSILSGRILSPLAALASIIVQWANTKASLQDLDRLWQLQQDMPDNAVPLIVDQIDGTYNLSDVAVDYAGFPAISVEHLTINKGESIAVLGPIGSGKTSLLRVLSGLYKPQRGRVTLDGLNIAELDRSILAQNVAYAPQDGRLFAGTLRENLIIGMDDPGDAALTATSRQTGLFDSVIAPHPKGLSRLINEGGTGLSGGQRQLVHITRAILRNPKVWLLDEPTASMDSQSEEQVIAALKAAQTASPASVFVFVTHKPQIAVLAKRVIILQQGKIVLDGPRDEVLRALQGDAAAAARLRPEKAVKVQSDQTNALIISPPDEDYDE